MSLHLRIDELQEALTNVRHPNASNYERVLLGVADAMACDLAAHYGCRKGEASQQGKAFAGLCVSFHPVYRDQPFPDDLEQFDDGGREGWEEHATELVTPFPAGPVYWRRLTVDDLADGVRVRCSNGGIGSQVFYGVVDSFETGKGGAAYVEYDHGGGGYWTVDCLETHGPGPALETAPAVAPAIIEYAEKAGFRRVSGDGFEALLLGTFDDGPFAKLTNRNGDGLPTSDQDWALTVWPDTSDEAEADTDIQCDDEFAIAMTAVDTCVARVNEMAINRDLAEPTEAPDDYRFCKACGRYGEDCSRDPCPAVIADREA